MKNAPLGLTVPVLLLLAAASAGFAYPATAQATTYEVSGIVVSDTGAPLAGVQVNGYTYMEDPSRSSSGSNDNTVTDEEGRFTLRLAEGKGTVSVYYEKWRSSDFQEIAVTGVIEDLKFTLQTPPPKTAIIAGVVVGENGAPVEGAEVQLSYSCCYIMAADSTQASTEPSMEPAMDEPQKPMTRPAIMPPMYDDFQTTKTDADGRFRFESYGGPRQITAWAKGYAQTTLQVDAKEKETIDVEIQLEKVPARSAILEGRVLNAETGLPIAGAHVSVRSLEWGRYAEAQSDQDGRYRIQTFPGWSEISVNFWPRYGEPIPLAAESDAVSVDSDATIARPSPLDPQYYPLTLVLDLEAGEHDRDFEIEPKPKPTIALVGYVVDPEAKMGVEGARVNVWNLETGDWGEAITDATGSFRILVRPGHYSGSAWKEGYLSGTQSFLVDNTASQRVDLVLPKGTTKYAPCYDETDCGPIIMYADGAKASSGDGATATGIMSSAPPPAPGQEPATRSAEMDESDTAAQAAGPDTSRAATFSGTGGGLPPYSAEGAPAAAGEQKASSEVPAIGLLALLAVAAMGALGMRSRRREMP